jgi:hypothetical protein
MELHPPASFTSICRLFHQDIDKIHTTLDEMATYAVRDLSSEERAEVGKFLDELLGGGYSGGEIRAIWRRSPADVYFRDNEQLITLLKLMREKIANPQARRMV